MGVTQLLAIAALIGTMAAVPEPTLVTLARSLPHLDPGLYSSQQSRLIESKAKPTPTSDLRALLSHPESRVRAVAAVALHLRLGPLSLPDIASLGADEGLAPPLRIPFAVPGGANGGNSSPAFGKRTQTVADVASLIVNTYMQRVGMQFGPRGKGFAAYWAPRSKRTHGLGWFAVKVDRLALGAVPTSKESQEAIRQLRQRINRLPEHYRDWLLFALGVEDHIPGIDVLNSPTELLAVAKRIPLAQLLRFLEGELPEFEDPDFKFPPGGALSYERVAAFILRHIIEIVPNDLPTTPGQQGIRHQIAHRLLKLRDLHRKAKAPAKLPSWPSALWTVAAADLLDNRAIALLHRAWKDNPATNSLTELRRQTTLIEALWRHGQRQEQKFILNWFYRTHPVGGIHGLGPAHIAHLCSGPSFRMLLRAILLDSRLESLDPGTFSTLALAANAAAPSPSERPIPNTWQLFRWGNPPDPKHYAALRAFAQELR